MKSNIYKRLKRPIISLAFMALSLFLILNILYSQNVNELYFQLTSEDKNAAVVFLKKTKLLPNHSQDFKDQLDEYKQIYGREIEDEVFFEDVQRNQNINDFKEILNKNPNSRDTLYNLYLLETKADNQEDAQKYLEKAKKLDPLIISGHLQQPK